MAHYARRTTALRHLAWAATLSAALPHLMPLAPAAAAQPAPYQWQQATILGGGYITGLYFHPRNGKVLYMRTDMGGAYRLDFAANRWVPLLDGFGFDDYMSTHGVSSIAFDPADDQKVYMLTGMYTTTWGSNGAVLRSSDRGATWQRTNLPFKADANMGGRWCADRLQVDPNLPSTLLIGTAGGLLYRSTDSAVTWTQVKGFPEIASDKYGVAALEFVGGEPGKPTQTIYAGVNRSAGGPTLYKSSDGGATWKPVSGGVESTPSRYLNKMVKDARGRLLLVYNNAPDNNMGDAKPKQGWLYRLDPANDSWTLLRATSGFGIGAVAADPQDANVLLLTSLAKWSGTLDLWRSADAGATWKAITVKRSGEPPYITDGWPYPHWQTDIDIAPGDSNLAMVSGVAGIYRTTQASSPAQTWEFYNDGMEQTCINDLVCPPTGPTPLFSATFDISGFRHDDLSVSPPNFKPDLDGSLDIDLAPQAPAKLVRTATKPPFGAFSSDAGVTWKPFGKASAVSGGGNAAISADGVVILWSPGGAAPLYSADGGTTWSAVAGLPKGALVAADDVSPDVLYAYSRDTGEFFRSSDKGKTFASVATGLATKGKKPVVNPQNKGDIWLGHETGLLHSTDGGSKWAEVTGVAKVVALGLGKASSQGGYPAIYLVGAVGSAKGIFRSDDAGANWLEISDPQHQFGLAQAITGDMRRYGRVYIGTNGRGILYGDPAAR